MSLETCWATGILNDNNGYATTSNNIIPDVFTQAAFGNADYGQKNAFQHVMNTVLYHYKQGNILFKVQTFFFWLYSTTLYKILFSLFILTM